MTRLILEADPRPGVRLLTLNRPDKHNALSVEMVLELAQAFARAEADDGVRCVVLAGNERAFSAGADIKGMLEHGPAAYEDPRRMRAWAAIEGFEKPLIAGVAGFAFGGGFELALTADFIVASERARFGLPEVRIGVFPGDGGTQRLTRIAGRPFAMRMILTGEPIDAATALRAGIVAEVVAPERTLDRALELAETIAANAPVALRLARQAVRAAEETGLRAGLQIERQGVGLAMRTEDRIEGMRAFVDKRAPRFQGR